MTFTQKLNEALKVVPLAKLDKRLKTDSDFYPIAANTQKSKQSTSTTGPSSLPPPVHTNLKRERLPLSDSVLHEEMPTATSTMDTNLASGPMPEENEITEKDLPPLPGQEQQNGGGMPSGDGGYTVESAKGQLDGIIKHWLDLAGNFPEGEQRHNFLEIGERLREISAVLNRDFSGQGQGVASVDAAPSLEPPEETPPLEGPPLA